MTNTNNPDVPANPVVEAAEARRDLVKAIVLCLLGVVAVRSFFFEPFKIPSSSMVPTLRIGDHIFVSKFPYGLSIPFSKIEIVGWGQPKRGEIIVFLFPRAESLHYIKRVIGVPGDRIEFKGRDLFVNGDLIQKEEIKDPTEMATVFGEEGTKGELYKETIEGITHYVKYSNLRQDFQKLNHVVETVPNDKFFVVGDNRDDSYDSRSWGFVPKENIKGRAEMIWLSLDNEKPWGADKIRWSRAGNFVK